MYSVDDSKPDGSHPAIMGFVSAHAARALQLLTPEQRRAAVTSHYARIYGFSEAPVRFVEQNWSAEAFSGGCYMGVSRTGTRHVRQWDWRQRPAQTLMSNAPLSFTAAEKLAPRLSTLAATATVAAAAGAAWLVRRARL